MAKNKSELLAEAQAKGLDVGENPSKQELKTALAAAPQENAAQDAAPVDEDAAPADNGGTLAEANPFHTSADGLGRPYNPAVDGEPQTEKKNPWQ